MLKNLFKKKVSPTENAIASYPAVNLTPTDVEELKKILRAALPNIKAENNPLAWSWDPDLWVSGKLHYLIPHEVATTKDIAEFLRYIRTASLTFPGGPFIWDLNSLDNLVFLPTSHAERKQKAGIFAAIYSASDEPYQAYCQFVAKILRNIKNNHDETLANTENSVQSRALAAMRSAAQILDFQRNLRAGLVSTSPENVKYFLSDTDELLFGRPDRPATVKVKFQQESVSVVLPDYVQMSKTPADQIVAAFGDQDSCKLEISRPHAAGLEYPEEFGVYLVKKFGEQQGITVEYSADGKAIIPVPPLIKQERDQLFQVFHFTIGTKRSVFTMTLTCPPLQNLPEREKTRINEIINGVIATITEENPASSIH
ncbi:hypothetical protein A1507_10115 [Methylomonas koyamae]|uniref:Uncharacterized protein n=1 Tax=Methylomonas koyamae TaxID=702114 RepID=A0A177NM30_9GAMM|nr:hypothetical protein [Methylomonas koyamae]OAI18090.1 hypothetical protein A1507_10115 [Methylomonas koyamae]